MLMPGYDVAKAAQAAAYFALKSGGKINVLKLSKLLYLAEREFMERFDEPMFYDRLVSMPDGPVVSITLNLINGDAEHETWERFIAPRERYDITVADEVTESSFQNLSIADVGVLSDLWGKFGSFDKYDLRDWTHVSSNIPEWEDPKGSSNKIPHARVFEALEKPNAKELAEDVEAHRDFVSALNSA